MTRNMFVLRVVHCLWKYPWKLNMWICSVSQWFHSVNLISKRTPTMQASMCVIFFTILFSATRAENSSCGEYFGDFPQQNRRLGQDVQDLAIANDSAVSLGGYQNILTVNVALLLPSKDGEGCDDCVLRPVMPVIELGIARAQDMLNEFMLEQDGDNQTVIRLRRMSGDTKCSSTVGPLVAVEMVNRSRPGTTCCGG